MFQLSFTTLTNFKIKILLLFQICNHYDCEDRKGLASPVTDTLWIHNQANIEGFILHYL